MVKSLKHNAKHEKLQPLMNADGCGWVQMDGDGCCNRR